MSRPGPLTPAAPDAGFGASTEPRAVVLARAGVRCSLRAAPGILGLPVRWVCACGETFDDPELAAGHSSRNVRTAAEARAVDADRA